MKGEIDWGDYTSSYFLGELEIYTHKDKEKYVMYDPKYDEVLKTIDCEEEY